MLPNDFATHDFVDVVLQGVDFAGNLFNAVKRHDANFSILQRNRIAGVVIVNDAVQSNHFPSHLKPGYLVTTIFCVDAGFEKTCANGIQRGEFFPGVKKCRSTLDAFSDGHELINPHCSGDKSSQSADIKGAIAMAKEI